MQASPIRWYSKDWNVECEDGRVVLLDLATFREGAELELGGESFSFVKPGIFGKEFFLRSGDQDLARAVKPSVWRNHFEVETGKSRYEVRKVRAFRRAFQVTEGGRPVGIIEPLGLFTRRTRIDLPQDWPLPFRLFVFWLVLVIWNREAAAAAAGGA